MVPPYSYLASLVSKMIDAPVLCIGDCMLDRFIYGDVTRISPEAPIPVLNIKNEIMMLGGGGNVARNISTLRAKPFFLAAVGDDWAGNDVARLLEQEKTIEQHLMVEYGRKTTLKTRFVASGQQLLRADHETLAPLSEKTAYELLHQAEYLMPSIKALALSDYAKGLLSATTLRQLISLATAQNVPVFIDPKGNDYSKYRGATLVKPNRKELAEATSMPVDSLEAIIAAGRYLIRDFGISYVLVTRSHDGMTLLSADSEWHFATEARDVFDVSGAGDTVLAVLAAATAAGIEIQDAVRLANTAAGIVVGRLGTATVCPDDLVNALHQDDLETGNNKIVSLEGALEKIAFWRAKGQRIGFTNGCFDLLHPGHISLLSQAHALCDRLVVGLNSDASVKQLKGEERPIQSEAARATVLASLQATDLVILFEEDTPIELIKAVRPDVLVKGADYTVDTVVGADIVKELGGQIFLAEIEEGFSTTKTISRIKS